MSHREQKQQYPSGRNDDMEIMRRVIERFGLNGTSMAASLTGFIARKQEVLAGRIPESGGDRVGAEGADNVAAAKYSGLGSEADRGKKIVVERHVIDGHDRGCAGGTSESEEVTSGSIGDPNENADARDAEVLTRALRRLGISDSTASVEGWVAQRTKAQPIIRSKGKDESTPARTPSVGKDEEKGITRRHPIVAVAVRKSGLPPLSMNRGTPGSGMGETGNRAVAAETEAEVASPQKSATGFSLPPPRMATPMMPFVEELTERHGTQDSSQNEPEKISDAASTKTEFTSLPKSVAEFSLPTPLIATPMMSFGEEDATDPGFHARGVAALPHAKQQGGFRGWGISRIDQSNGGDAGTKVLVQPGQNNRLPHQENISPRSRGVAQTSCQSVALSAENAPTGSGEAPVPVPPSARDPSPTKNARSTSPMFGTNSHRRISPMRKTTSPLEGSPGASTQTPLIGPDSNAWAISAETLGGEIQEPRAVNVTSALPSAGGMGTIIPAIGQSGGSQITGHRQVQAAGDSPLLAPDSKQETLHTKPVSSARPPLSRDASVPEPEDESHRRDKSPAVATQGSETVPAGSNDGVARAVPVMWSFRDKTGEPPANIPSAPKGGFCWQKGVGDTGLRGPLDGVKAYDARRRCVLNPTPKSPALSHTPTAKPHQPPNPKAPRPSPKFLSCTPAAILNSQATVPRLRSPTTQSRTPPPNLKYQKWVGARLRTPASLNLEPPKL